MSSITVRIATKHDTESLLKIPQYSDCDAGFPPEEEILVAEENGKVLGAISVGHRDISCISGEWKESYGLHLNTNMENVSGFWISKLYVFPEHRRTGIGTKLIKETVKYLNERGITETYAGIYIKTKFRETSHHIFERNGFKKIGSCICLLSQGYCRGTLLKKKINFQSGRMK